MPRIDKRTFLAAVECRTLGWHTYRSPADELTYSLKWRFFTGNEVARAARKALGDGSWIAAGSPEDNMKATALALADARSQLLFEATFATDDFVARADALRRNGEAWDLIEIKSGKLPADALPESVKAEYIDDVAYTAFVARVTGTRLGRCALSLVRGDYTPEKPRNDLVGEIDVTDLVLARAATFEGIAKDLAADIRATRAQPTLIFACRDCALYHESCIGVGVEDPLFALPRLSAQRFEQLKPYERISLIPADVELTASQRRVAQVITTGAALIEPNGLSRLNAVEWPAHYLDFESASPAIPWFADARPYDQVPFQFSIRVCDGPGNEVAEHAYVAPLDRDWRRELAEKLIEGLGSKGSIVTYSGFERRMLKVLADAAPELSGQLTDLENRLFDLEPLFKEGYTHPRFQGRTSLKSVLPVIAPDLTYDNLHVGNGDDAAGLFSLMMVGEYSSKECSEHRDNLLEYCGLDTRGLVRLHKALVDIFAGVMSP